MNGVFGMSTKRHIRNASVARPQRVAPGILFPGTIKESARLNISKILVSRFLEMNLKYPRLTIEEEKKLAHLKRRLLNAR